MSPVGTRAVYIYPDNYTTGLGNHVYPASVDVYTRVMDADGFGVNMRCIYPVILVYPESETLLRSHIHACWIIGHVVRNFDQIF